MTCEPTDWMQDAACEIADWLAVSGERQSYLAAREVDSIDAVIAIIRRHLPAHEWRPIAEAPKDGSAILGFGIHSGPQPDAQRGIQAGDHWWAIMLWDCWRNPDPAGWGERSLWVFAKDGKPTWSHPTHYMPLPPPPAATNEEEK